MYKEKASDEKEVLKVTKDYIEGWYQGDKKRMENALHPAMLKRRFKDGVLGQLTTEQMVWGTGYGGGKDVPKDSYDISIEILDISNGVASVVTRSEYIDYLHLAKVNGVWKIINVLWDLNY